MSPAPPHHDLIFLGLMRVTRFIELSRRSTGKALIGLPLLSVSGLIPPFLWQRLTAWSRHESG